MTKEELEEKKSKREFNKMMADMRHDLNKEHHWDERAAAQDKQWRFQRLIWVVMGILTGMAIIANAYVRTHPENFMPQPTVKAVVNDAKK